MIYKLSLIKAGNATMNTCLPIVPCLKNVARARADLLGQRRLMRSLPPRLGELRASAEKSWV
jgi:hypothetical protein